VLESILFPLHDVPPHIPPLALKYSVFYLLLLSHPPFPDLWPCSSLSSHLPFSRGYIVLSPICLLLSIPINSVRMSFTLDFYPSPSFLHCCPLKLPFPPFISSHMAPEAFNLTLPLSPFVKGSTFERTSPLTFNPPFFKQPIYHFASVWHFNLCQHPDIRGGNRAPSCPCLSFIPCFPFNLPMSVDCSLEIRLGLSLSSNMPFPRPPEWPPPPGTPRAAKF